MCTNMAIILLTLLMCPLVCASQFCLAPIRVSSSNLSLATCRDSFNKYISYRLQKTHGVESKEIILTECDFYALVFGHAKFVVGMQTSNAHYCHHILRPSCYEVYKRKIRDKHEQLRIIKYAAKMLKYVLKSIKRTPGAIDDLTSE